MEPLPVVAPSCSLDDLDLREQLTRYRAVGEGSHVLERRRQRLAIRVDSTVSEELIVRLIEVERGCCPFFELSWDRASRRLAVAVSKRDHEAALDAIAYSLVGRSDELSGSSPP